MQRTSCIVYHACQLTVRLTDADQTSSALNEYKHDVFVQRQSTSLVTLHIQVAFVCHV